MEENDHLTFSPNVSSHPQYYSVIHNPKVSTKWLTEKGKCIHKRDLLDYKEKARRDTSLNIMYSWERPGKKVRERLALMLEEVKKESPP